MSDEEKAMIVENIKNNLGEEYVDDIIKYLSKKITLNDFNFKYFKNMDKEISLIIKNKREQSLHTPITGFYPIV